MEINLDDLQDIISTLISRLKEVKGNKIEIESDFYWEVPSRELYYPYAQPQNLVMGQLTEDWKEIMRLTKHDTEVSYDLKRFANIITAISIEYDSAF